MPSEVNFQEVGRSSTRCVFQVPEKLYTYKDYTIKLCMQVLNSNNFFTACATRHTAGHPAFTELILCERVLHPCTWILVSRIATKKMLLAEICTCKRWISARNIVVCMSFYSGDQILIIFCAFSLWFKAIFFPWRSPNTGLIDRYCIVSNISISL